MAWALASSRRPKEHVCLYSEAALQALLKRSGFGIVRVRRPVPDKLAVYAAACS